MLQAGTGPVEARKAMYRANSFVRKLDPILDKDIIRVGERLPERRLKEDSYADGNKKSNHLTQTIPYLSTDPAGNPPAGRPLRKESHALQTPSEVLDTLCQLYSQKGIQRLCLLSALSSQSWRTENG